MWHAFLAAGVVASVLLAPHPVAAQATTSTAAFSGVDAGPNGNAFYFGAITALNGDFGRDGVLLRGLAAYGTYDYQATVGDVHGRYWLFDEMIGYQIIRPGIRIAGYIGAEEQSHKLSPFDPANRVVGTETGFKVAGDLTLGHNQPLFLNLAGSYSTDFDTYWSRLRVGNEGSNAWCIGGFAQMRIDKTPIDITVAAGQHTNDKGGIFANKDGAYASLNVGLAY